MTNTTTAAEAGDMRRGCAFVAQVFNGDDDGTNVIIDEAAQCGRLAQLCGAIGVVLRDGFSADFAGSDVVAAP